MEIWNFCKKGFSDLAHPDDKKKQPMAIPVHRTEGIKQSPPHTCTHTHLKNKTKKHYGQCYPNWVGAGRMTGLCYILPSVEAAGARCWARERLSPYPGISPRQLGPAPAKSAKWPDPDSSPSLAAGLSSLHLRFTSLTFLLPFSCPQMPPAGQTRPSQGQLTFSHLLCNWVCASAAPTQSILG